MPAAGVYWTLMPRCPDGCLPPGPEVVEIGDSSSSVAGLGTAPHSVIFDLVALAPVVVSS